ncbi:hypothetical protein I552_1707 [Mycobacterium xenopi 3993]|nr:hypothetical protein I552_1707 [Mycobacterium xenopi 3993]
MTYSPGSPDIHPRSPRFLRRLPQSFAKSDDGASKLQLYLTVAVVALGLAAYLASFGPMFTISADLGHPEAICQAVAAAWRSLRPCWRRC